MDTKTSNQDTDILFTPVSEAQIETVNKHRIMAISLGTIAFEIINLFNPNFWSTPILWIGAIYLSAVSAAFLLILFFEKPARLLEKPVFLHTLFWVLFSLGFFPFLIRDAGVGDSPLNCVLLCTVLICAPLLRVRSLSYIFLSSLAVNLLAAFYTQYRSGLIFQYFLELIVINAVAYFMARNLHGRYFLLLDEQQRFYDKQLKDKLVQESLQARIEQDRLLNASRSEFLSRMSHDLRTPLNAVIGLSDIAMDESLSRDQIRSYLSDINHSAHHLLALINDVLDMSKLESRKMALHPAPYGIAEFSGTISSIIGTPCKQKGLDFTMTMDDGFPPYILVDKLRFNQIFLNLLSNSMKFTPAGGRISLVMSHTEQAGETSGITAVVSDTGRGMSQNFISHAFDSFSQETGGDGESGTGLGLTIVKSITQLMGGHITLESKQGTGTCITVFLPVKSAAPPDDQAPELSEGFHVLKGKRILLCEDHPLNQKVAECLLEKEGMTVDTVENGSLGVSRFEQSPVFQYDAVLMDIRMPVMDGLAAASAIRALSRADAASVPIIAMTANAYDEDIEATRAAGMNAHLSKPVDPQTLYRTLSRFLAKDVPAARKSAHT